MKRNYRVFHRPFWRRPTEEEKSRYPDNRVPYLGAKKMLIQYTETEEEAQEVCRRWNTKHPPKWDSRKAEYTKATF